MKRLISTEKNLPWIETESILETFISDEMPPIDECSSAYAFVLKNKELLQTELREGERPLRQLDIPGGHIDSEETPEEAVMRETFEETGVQIQEPRLVAYSKITIVSEKPDNYQYPYPVSYMLFYKSDAYEEFPFEGNKEVHGRVWLPEEEFERSEWCKENRVLVAEVLKLG
jgi:8-oxo-dGTP diphosphatase